MPLSEIPPLMAGKLIRRRAGNRRAFYGENTMDTQLMDTFHFDVEDLSANRAGTLSHKQAEQIKKDDTCATRVVWLLALSAGAGAVMLLLPLVRAGQFPDTQEKMVGMVFGILLALASIWFFRGAIFSKIDTTVRKVQGKMSAVKSVGRSGNVSDPESSRRNIIYHEMVVGGRTFGVTPDVFNTVVLEREGETYAVYFIEKTNRLLSLEHIPSA